MYIPLAVVSAMQNHIIINDNEIGFESSFGTNKTMIPKREFLKMLHGAASVNWKPLAKVYSPETIELLKRMGPDEG